MKPITAVDPNFLIPKTNLPQDLRFFSVADHPSLVFGLLRQENCFRRLPEEIALAVSDGVYQLHWHTAGGRVRFCTNSRRLAIAARLNHVSKMPHFAFSGSIGFDLYEKIDGKHIFMGAAIPPLDIQDHLECFWELDGDDTHELTLHLPLYSGVDELYIGIDENATVTPAPAYTHSKPVVYYGSSITQGGCASRPANAYPNLLSLLLDCNHVNLGFSGNARAEDAMADHISKLEMSVFVFDYDYNAPNEAHLAATHEKMYQKIRSAQPDLPIIFMSMPKRNPLEEATRQRRLEIIRQTYVNAVASGDGNVYLIPGEELLGDCAEMATVDNCHPNDLGFYMMALALKPILSRLLRKE